MNEHRDYEGDHVEVGWNEENTFRWIEAGQARLEEDDRGAVVTLSNPRKQNECWLSAGENSA